MSEQRLTRLESQTDTIKDHLIELKSDLSHVKAKQDDAPTKDWMTTRLVWVVGAFALVTTAVTSLIGYIITLTGGQVPPQ